MTCSFDYAVGLGSVVVGVGHGRLKLLDAIAG